MSTPSNAGNAGDHGMRHQLGHHEPSRERAQEPADQGHGEADHQIFDEERTQQHARRAPSTLSTTVS